MIRFDPHAAIEGLSERQKKVLRDSVKRIRKVQRLAAKIEEQTKISVFDHALPMYCFGRDYRDLTDAEIDEIHLARDEIMHRTMIDVREEPLPDWIRIAFRDNQRWTVEEHKHVDGIDSVALKVVLTPPAERDRLKHVALPPFFVDSPYDRVKQ